MQFLGLDYFICHCKLEAQVRRTATSTIQAQMRICYPMSC
uniref:Uncharacterized protein n=1 Tax=Arundo donax TaxID=35708 RepID=A0A0A9FE62_ARUDO